MSINHSQNGPHAPFFIGGKLCRTILLLEGESPRAIAPCKPDALALWDANLVEQLIPRTQSDQSALPFLTGISATLDHDAFAAELQKLMALKPDGLILSGANKPADCQRLDAMLRAEEATAGMMDGQTVFVLMLGDETAGFANTVEMAHSSKRLIAIGQDSQAITTAVGAKSLQAAAPLLQTTRSAIQLAAASARITCFDVLSGDPQEVATQSDDLIKSGFGAIMCRDPAAVTIINAAFDTVSSL
ncbi:hypothetical protein [Rhizobium sp.]|jgi:citrate lyase beta subunit|uniref:hypothetical protein n=1 Tax=Rhizobium sp. TaxID=391 RepID=UPI000E876A4D|nr:hypothetical protein [Rhizobium sp.]